MSCWLWWSSRRQPSNFRRTVTRGEPEGLNLANTLKFKPSPEVAEKNKTLDYQPGLRTCPVYLIKWAIWKRYRKPQLLEMTYVIKVGKLLRDILRQRCFQPSVVLSTLVSLSVLLLRGCRGREESCSDRRLSHQNANPAHITTHLTKASWLQSGYRTSSSQWRTLLAIIRKPESLTPERWGSLHRMPGSYKELQNKTLSCLTFWSAPTVWRVLLSSVACYTDVLVNLIYRRGPN